MAEKIIWYTVSFGCAILFYCIGIYADKLEKPMWFWSGSEVDPFEITDVRQYNRENATMWKLYSLWFALAGVAEIWNSIVALVALVFGCTAGAGILIYWYSRIYNKYKKH